MSAAEQRHYCPVCSAVFRTPFSRCPLDGNVLAELEGDPLVGTTLDGRYVIEECIGEGGMGRVYRAKHTRMSRTYAIKILFGDHAGDTRMRSRFAREAEAVSRLSHANVISVVDFGETTGGLLYLVMDLAEGESLAHLMIREAPFPAPRAIAILKKLSKGLSHAHNQGLVHRDFKGENVIMVTEEEQEVPKIVDFGICMITEDSPSNTMLTSNGMVMGTPAVMAPEQASGDTVDHRTDLFSLGIVGYQMLSGLLPFEGTPLDMARKNLYEPIPPIQERSGVAVAPALEAIITKLTAKQPDERYQSAKEALADLEALPDMESSGSWVPTPLPPPVPGLGAEGHPPAPYQGYPESGPVAAPYQTPTPQPGYSPGHPSSTPMMTELVSNSGIAGESAPGRRKLMFFGLGGLAILIGVAVGVSTADKKNSETKASGATATNGVATAAPADAGPALVAEVAPPKAAAADASPIAVPETPSETPTPPEPKATTEAPPKQTPKKQSGKRNADKKNGGKKNGGKANRPNKTSTEPKPAPTLAESKQLYLAVGSALDSLEASKGKSKYSQLRREYNAISYMRLVRDASIQPVYHQTLLRLRRKIRKAQK